MAISPVRCPICRGTCSPDDGFVLFMEVCCPICWEKVPQAMCLPCGHAVCNEDFQNLGGPATRPTRTRSAPASARASAVATEVPEDHRAAETYRAATGFTFLAAAANTMATIHGPTSSFFRPAMASIALGVSGLVASGVFESDENQLPTDRALDQKPEVLTSLTLAAASTGAAASLNAATAAHIAYTATEAASLATAAAAQTTGLMAHLSGATAAAQAQAIAATATATIASATATSAAASAAIIVPASAAVVGYGIYKLTKC